jgi:tetratricopeptide (TPR) repeat protein
MRAPLLTPALACFVFGTIHASNQSRNTPCPDERALQAAIQYRSLVGQYRRGDRAGAVERAARLSDREMSDVFSWVFSRKLCRDDPTWRTDELRAAAMLHTDAGERSLAAHEFDLTMRQLGFGRVFVRSIEPAARDVAERWFVAVSRRLRLAGLVSPWAGEFLDAARSDIPDSAAILFESGIVAELSAAGASTLEVRRSAEVSPHIGAAQPPTVANLARQRFYRAMLNDGAEWFRRTMALDSGNRWAPVHLARLLLALGRNGEAAVLLERVLAVSVADGPAHVARLLLARVHEEEGRPEAALRLYADAIHARPDAQSAYFAASLTLFRLARSEEARHRLREAVVRARRDTDDPWWAYLFDTSDAVHAALDALRRETGQ